MKINNRIILLLLCAVMTSAFLFACSSGDLTPAGNSPTPQISASPAVTPASASASMVNSPTEDARPPASPSINPGGIIYQNTEYGFDFNLPKDWDGHTVIPENWEGRSITDDHKIVETGPIILIRNPKWTDTEPMQDIPIMVYTIAQWDALLREEFVVSAAPVGPSELGRNSKYVFALPARYNYSYLAGYEEVENIISSNPLHAYDKPK